MEQAHLDVPAFHAALEAERRSRGQSWRQVASEAGVSPSTLTRMAQGKRPDVDSFAALVRWLGAPAEQFFAPAPLRGDSRTPGFAAVVSTHLRADKELTPKTADALQEIIRAAYETMKSIK